MSKQFNHDHFFYNLLRENEEAIVHLESKYNTLLEADLETLKSTIGVLKTKVQRKEPKDANSAIIFLSDLSSTIKKVTSAFPKKYRKTESEQEKITATTAMKAKKLNATDAKTYASFTEYFSATLSKVNKQTKLKNNKLFSEKNIKTYSKQMALVCSAYCKKKDISKKEFLEKFKDKFDVSGVKKASLITIFNNIAIVLRLIYAVIVVGVALAITIAAGVAVGIEAMAIIGVISFIFCFSSLLKIFSFTNNVVSAGISTT